MAEASERFDIPETWIRAVIHHESGGRAFVNGRPLRGPSGTIGLMQVAPDTYRYLAERYELGPDPGDPYDNVMAGTALIREMYEEFGSPHFLVAYNCGARCAADIRAGTRKLPETTRKYLAALGPTIARNGPLRSAWSVHETRDRPAPSDTAGRASSARHVAAHAKAGPRKPPLPGRRPLAASTAKSAKAKPAKAAPAKALPPAAAERRQPRAT